MKNVFTHTHKKKKKKIKINLRTSKLSSLLDISTEIFSLKTFSFNNSYLWHYLPDQVNIETSIKAYKENSAELVRNYMLLCDLRILKLIYFQIIILTKPFFIFTQLL